LKKQAVFWPENLDFCLKKSVFDAKNDEMQTPAGDLKKESLEAPFRVYFQ
jgi:hypothetical protein